MPTTDHCDYPEAARKNVTPDVEHVGVASECKVAWLYIQGKLSFQVSSGGRLFSMYLFIILHLIISGTVLWFS